MLEPSHRDMVVVVAAVVVAAMAVVAVVAVAAATAMEEVAVEICQVEEATLWMTKNGMVN
jgi:hypothetical protein